MHCTALATALHKTWLHNGSGPHKDNLPALIHPGCNGKSSAPIHKVPKRACTRAASTISCAKACWVNRLPSSSAATTALMEVMLTEDEMTLGAFAIRSPAAPELIPTQVGLEMVAMLVVLTRAK